MKANVNNYNKPKFLQDMLTGGEQLAEELKLIVDNFDKWLELSHMTFDNFLKFSTSQNFRIDCKPSYAYTVIQLFDGESSIGETIAFQTEEQNARYDTVFLLLYIACRLDEHDLSERRDYFYDITKAFCTQQILKFQV